MRYRHVIWDWNGTLLDDAWLCVEILNGLLRGAALPPISIEDYRASFSFPVVNFYQKVGFDFADVSFDAISERYISAYNRRRYECSLQPRVRETLDQIRAAGIDQSVLSAYHQDTLREVVAHYGLTDYFTHLSGLDNIRAEGKLDRGRAHLRTLDLHEAAHTVLLIGDTSHDHEVAAALGADCLLLEHGHMRADRLDACGVPLVASLDEAVEFVLQEQPQPR